jgi:N-methylhydantoinase A
MRKAPTTDDIVGGVIAALALAADAFELSVQDLCPRVERFGHGTTVGLNALLTGPTARTALITTLGFGDTLEIGRMKRQFSGLNETEVSDYLKRNQTAPIVDRRAVKEVAGRVDRTGAEIAALDEPGARAVAAELIADGVQAIAICTLWSTQNPAHERRLRELVLEAAPQIAISLSHEVSPSVGEYARMSTTAANAALKPVTSRCACRRRWATSA